MQPSPDADQSTVTGGEEEEDSDQEEEEEDEDEDDDALQCIACDKTFASLAAKRNHEASKKHKKQVAILRALLLEADANADSAVADELTAAGITLEDSEPEPEAKPDVKLTKRAKKARRRQLRAADAEERTEEEEEQANGAEPSLLPRSCFKINTTPFFNYACDGHPAKSQPTAAPQEACVCKVCSEEFPSKNKLFAHIKESGHAVLKTVAPTAKAQMRPKKSAKKSKK
ncbi:unnamed protein product [Dibothriocephalus latus]|uniref:C2H2-type domain-containing protein n=1 Tax=Dibothriocephalus latus TaxID=60516 RepID=A0A3P7LGN2_DIBLA|nr:unnamed protein product [Dibothriocephalus latus]